MEKFGWLAMSLPFNASVKEWQEYIKGQPTLGEQWVETCSLPGNPVVLSDTLGSKIKAKSALTGSIIIARRIKKMSPEQNIGVLLPTTAGGMLANLACMLLGKTVINLNYSANIDTLLSAVTQAEIKTIYSSSRFLEKLESRGFDTSLLKQKVKVINLEDLSASVPALEKISTLLLCKLAPAFLLKKWFAKKHSLEANAVILFSSGSEGEPKGILLSHHNLITNVKQIAQLLKVKKGDLVLANLPLFHAFGLTATLFMPLLLRAPVICHPDPTDVYACAKVIKEHKVSIMFGTSSFYRLYIRNKKIHSNMLDSLRLIVAGAEKLQKEVLTEFKSKFDQVIYEGYGATETAPVASVNIPLELLPSDSPRTFGNKVGSVGLPLPGTCLKIVDPESFKELPIGDAGLILISGGQVMKGYLNNPEKTGEVLTKIDGQTWYSTGDKGYVDVDGFLFIQDRYSRFAKIAGEMVSLGNIETAIKGFIDDPELELVAVNIPDNKKGEKIVVLSTRKLDAVIVREGMGNVGLSALAFPSTYITVNEIPCLGSGKTDFARAKKMALGAHCE